MAKMIEVMVNDTVNEEAVQSWKQFFLDLNTCYTAIAERKEENINMRKFSNFITRMEEDFRIGKPAADGTVTGLVSLLGSDCAETEIRELVERYASVAKQCEDASVEVLFELSKLGVSGVSDYIAKMKNEEIALLWVEANRQQNINIIRLTGMLHPLADPDELKAKLDKAMDNFNKYIRKARVTVDDIAPLMREDVSREDLEHIVVLLATACRTRRTTWELLFERNKAFYRDTITRTDDRNGGTMTKDDFDDIMGEIAARLPKYLKNFRYGMAKYTTFITPYIFQPYRSVKRNVITTGLSTYEENQLHAVNKAISDLLDQGREITVENIARYMKIGVRAAATALAIKERVNTVSMDDEDFDGHKMQISSSAYSMEEQLERKDTAEAVKKRVMAALRKSNAPGLTLNYQTALGLMNKEIKISAYAKATGYSVYEVRRAVEDLKDVLRSDKVLRDMFGSGNINPQLSAIMDLEKALSRTNFELCLSKESAEEYLDDVSASLLLPGEAMSDESELSIFPG